MSYLFAGYVSDVESDTCRMVMRDVTNPTNPDEEWTVSLKRLPDHPVEGQRLTFEIFADGGVFTLDDRRWTAEDLRRIDEKAKELASLFGLERLDRAEKR